MVDVQDPLSRTVAHWKSTRRRLLAGAVASIGLAAADGRPTSAAQPHASPAAGSRLAQRGVNYDVGTVWGGFDSRLVWNDEVLRREIDAIADDLHCTAILIHGTDTSRLVESVAYALERGLAVWVQPRFMNAPQTEVLANLADVAAAVESLRGPSRFLGLNVAVEASIFTTDIIPGDSFEGRITYLIENLSELPLFNERLDEFLGDCLAAAAAFQGPTTYSSGPWEGVDWSPFAFAGIDHYRGADNAEQYVDELREFVKRAGRPVIVTEFGCCTFEGAEAYGGSGYEVIDYSTDPPTISEGLVRSERAQAEEILELLSIFETEGVAGAFVYQFIDQGTPHSPVPALDLDMGSFSIVKTFAPGTPGKPDDPSYWEPKEAYIRLAERFAALK